MSRVLYVTEAEMEKSIPSFSQLLLLYELETGVCTADSDINSYHIHLLKVDW